MLIAGDQILPRISPNISVQAHEPDGDPLARYLRRLTSCAGSCRPTFWCCRRTICRSSGSMRASTSWPRITTRAAPRCWPPATGRKSAADMVPVLFRRQLDRHQTGFALGEALAHLHYLIGQGALDRGPAPTSVDRYLRVAT